MERIVRWTKRRKLALMHQMANKELTIQEAMTAYHLSAEELQNWVARFQAFKADGLKATKIQQMRLPHAA